MKKSGKVLFIEQLGLSAKASGGDFQKAIEALGNSQMRAVDHVAYTTAPLGGSKYVKVFQNTDKKDIGLRNIAEGKLDPNRPMVVTHIRFTAVTLGLAPTEATIKGAAFGNINAIAGLKNAELTLKVDNKILLDKMNVSRFVTPADAEEGIIELSDPIVIAPDREIQIELEAGDAIVANTVGKFEFIGLVAVSTN